MSAIAAIGEAQRVGGLAFAGVAVHAAEDAPEVRAAWRGLPAAVGVVILTPAAHAAVLDELEMHEPRLLYTVLPA